LKTRVFLSGLAGRSGFTQTGHGFSGFLGYGSCRVWPKNPLEPPDFDYDRRSWRIGPPWAHGYTGSFPGCWVLTHGFVSCRAHRRQPIGNRVMAPPEIGLRFSLSVSLSLSASLSQHLSVSLLFVPRVSLSFELSLSLSLSISLSLLSSLTLSRSVGLLGEK